MNWAERRRFIIIGSAVAILIVILSATLFAFIYKAPSCMDRKQNQNETGVDCGGSCSRMCTAEVAAPVIDFARAVQSTSQRTDVIAYVQNKNTNAEARNAPYTVEIHAADGSLIARRDGTVDLPPATLVPIFIKGLISGEQRAQSAYLTFDKDAIIWTHPRTKSTSPLPVVKNITPDFTAAPKISATLENASAETLFNITVVVTVRDSAGTVMAATQTIVPTVPAQGNAPFTVTWNQSFTSEVAQIDMIPVIPLTASL